MGQLYSFLRTYPICLCCWSYPAFPGVISRLLNFSKLWKQISVNSTQQYTHTQFILHYSMHGNMVEVKKSNMSLHFKFTVTESIKDTKLDIKDAESGKNGSNNNIRARGGIVFYSLLVLSANPPLPRVFWAKNRPRWALFGILEIIWIC